MGIQIKLPPFRLAERSAWQSSTEFTLKYSSKSSTNNFNLHTLGTVVKSSTYNRNSSPRTDPCGTQEVTGCKMIKINCLPKRNELTSVHKCTVAR